MVRWVVACKSSGAPDGRASNITRQEEGTKDESYLASAAASLPSNSCRIVLGKSLKLLTLSVSGVASCTALVVGGLAAASKTIEVDPQTFTAVLGGWLGISMATAAAYAGLRELVKRAEIRRRAAGSPAAGSPPTAADPGTPTWTPSADAHRGSRRLAMREPVRREVVRLVPERPVAPPTPPPAGSVAAIRQGVIAAGRRHT